MSESNPPSRQFRIIENFEAMAAEARGDLHAGAAPVAGGGGGPHDPGMEAPIAVLEQIARESQSAMLALRSDVAGLDTRLRGVEVSIGRLEGKIDALTGTIVGQTSAALAKLPSWWQMPAVIGSTVALLVILYTGYRYLLAHGLL